MAGRPGSFPAAQSSGGTGEASSADPSARLTGNAPRQRIALFGGSFDPPHLGHVLCATWAYAASGVDRVWVLPSARHPYAKALSPWDQRWRMCQAAFGGLGFVELRDDELRNPSGYTIDLVEALAVRHPGTRWSLIGGTDTARDLPNWHRGTELAKLVEVIAVPRRGFDQATAALPDISSREIRRRRQAGQPIDELVPVLVNELIQSGHWYRPGS